MNTQTLLQIVAALAVAHAVRSAIEFTSITAKLQRLKSAVDGKDLPAYPVNINTRPKAYGLGIVMLAVLFLVAYFIVSVLGLDIEMSAWIAIVALLAIEVLNVVGFDRYHSTLEKLINKLAK